MKKRIEDFLKKPIARELISYVIFGTLTTVVAFATYALFRYLGLSIPVTNTLSHLCAIVFAYVTNKIWVFRARNFTLRKILAEFLQFLSSRLLALVLETLLLAYLVYTLGYNDLLSKAGTTVLVVILNYVTSKIIVFRKKKNIK